MQSRIGRFLHCSYNIDTILCIILVLCTYMMQSTCAFLTHSSKGIISLIHFSAETSVRNFLSTVTGGNMKFQKNIFILAACCLVFSLETRADTHDRIVGAHLEEVLQSACLTRPKAEAEAEKLALKSVQDYCRRAGFGWRSSSVMDLGNLDCKRCDSDNYSCGYSKTSLECRKAEPKLNWSSWFSGNP